MASTNWDTIERGAGLLPWILLTTPGRRQQAARSSRHLQIVVVVDGGVWLLGSDIWLHQPERRRKGEKGEQSNHEYSSKVLASKDLHYICMGTCVWRPYQWTELQNARIRGGVASPIEDYASGSLRLAACRRE